MHSSKNIKIIFFSSIIFLLILAVVGVAFSVIEISRRRKITPFIANNNSSASIESKIVDRNGNVLYTITNKTSDTGNSNKKAGHFVDYTLRELGKIYGEDLKDEGDATEYLQGKGYTVETTVDLEAQELLEKTMREQVQSSEFIKKVGAKNASSVLLNPKNGEILAMIGSIDYYGEGSSDKKFRPKINETLYPRGMGGTVTPVLYLSALRLGYQPSSPLPDYRVDLRGTGATAPYFPLNNDRTYSKYGKYVSMRTALEKQLIVPASAAYNLVGKSNYEKTYIDLNNWSNLGNSINGPYAAQNIDMPLIEQTHAYATIANEGIYNPKKVIKVIRDSNNKVIYDNQANKSEPRVGRKFVYAINDMNKNSFISSTDTYIQGLQKKMDIAGIGGLSINQNNQKTDITFIVYSPTFVLSLWAGNSCGSNCPINSEATSDDLYNLVYKPFLQKYESKIIPARFDSKPNGVSTIKECKTYGNQKECVEEGEEISISGPFELELADRNPKW